MTARILIVEDESELAAIVADYVAAAGYTAEVIADGKVALERATKAMPDLIVLDLMLPGIDGLSVCQALRAFSEVPILMLTARVEEVDRLLGLEAGADDYLCKPFSPRELVARIKAILRRTHADAADRPLWRIDEAARSIRVGAHPLDLTPSEYQLLATMLRRPGMAYSRTQLLDVIQRDNLDANDRTIDTHVKNLRRKLAAVLPEVEIIHSIYGVGYRVDW
ncbi:two-component system response regulator BaeR [Dyella sp. SG562]|jgi:two-component system response regulator BaeR|uniref:response regulator n=1 Tax=Dyella sp. SG562 TaxID=2587017 RepID=UPI00141EE97E|nr:response regulator [Dyella sp. SG562]NII72460.1 two-component system response regulator BaeR [Dyella sp. SG562]